MQYDYLNARFYGQLQVGDLAWSLAGLNRYLAWTGVYWSVASHACLVAEIIAAVPDHDLGLILGGLHHDDHECLIGDWPSPLKAALSDSARAEIARHARRADEAIWRALGIWDLVPNNADSSRLGVIKAADLAALEAERLALFSYRMEWGTEKIVNPKMLAVGQRLMGGDFARITGGQDAADRFVAYHAAVMQKLVTP
jgi:hypothetical protein